MTYDEFLTRVIDEGIAAARTDYASSPHKLKGAVAGFEACRGKDTVALAQLIIEAGKMTQDALLAHVPNYWEIRCFEAEVEWVCNCVSAMLLNEGLPTIVPPTSRGVMRAAEIIGIRPNAGPHAH